MKLCLFESLPANGNGVHAHESARTASIRRMLQRSRATLREAVAMLESRREADILAMAFGDVVPVQP